MCADGNVGECKTVVSHDVSVCPIVEANDFQWQAAASAGMPTTPQWRKFRVNFH